MPIYLYKFFIAWLITITIETGVILVIFKYVLKNYVTEFKLVVFASIFASSLTLPYVWFVFPYLPNLHYPQNLILSELFAWLAEALFYKIFLKLSPKQALLISLAANLASFVFGFLIGHKWN